MHLYIAWLIWHRRLGSRQNLTQPERTFIVIGLCLGVWFLGNLFITLHELLLGRERLTGWLRAWDTITMTGVALLPAALLHGHIAFWAMIDNYRVLKPHHVRRAGLALYVPIIFLPVTVYLINTGTYQPFLFKLRFFLVPYSIWYLLMVWASAAIDWSLSKRFGDTAVRERAFFKWLAILFVINGALEFLVVVVLRSGPNDYPWVTYQLFGVLPTFLVAYHVYRYKIVDLAIKGSLVYAAFAIVFIAVYTYGIRRLDQFLVARDYIKQPGVIEVILILGMFALAGPLVRLIDQMVERLFAREIGVYRDVVRQVSAGAAGFGEMDALVRYTEEIIRSGLDLIRVRIVPIDSTQPAGTERRLAEKMIRWEVDTIENDDDLAQIEATTAYALKREGKIIALMIITAGPGILTSDKRAILDVLAGQVAVEVESCQLVEEKVRLERELSSRERLATLGQMAAQVAHEVKNPLSSIKSIVQVMREEAALSGYDRDLELIVSEIDRLNRSVSQLLAFSRPSHSDLRPVELRDLISSTVALLGNEVKENAVRVIVEAERDVTLSGGQAGALREALSNLVINAVQACERGGEVTIQAEVEIDKATLASSRAASLASASSNNGPAGRLILSITDTGPGIPGKAQGRVFEPFYSTKSRGTGLGLAIVQRRAAELGGRVELTSPVADGRGTRFRLIVPLAPVTAEDAKDSYPSAVAG